MKKGKIMHKNIYVSIISFFLLIAIFSGVMIHSHFKEANEQEELYEQNNDLVGWICIEDTKINYPVMQSIDEPNFYLKHGFDKAYTNYGCPYVGESCDVNKPSDNLIIYGHHMKNGSMFSDLEKFKKKDFW